MSSSLKKHGPLLDFLIRHGIAPNVETANGILLAIFLFNIGITLFLAQTTFGFNLIPPGENLEALPVEVTQY